MLNRFSLSFIILCLFSFHVYAKGGNNPFAKNEVLNIGKEFSWNIDKQLVLATKSASDQKGNYYHLQYDNKQLKLIISSDAKGIVTKKFSQLEIKDAGYFSNKGKPRVLFVNISESEPFVNLVDSIEKVVVVYACTISLWPCLSHHLRR